MADHAQLVAIGIAKIRTVIIGMVLRAQSRRPFAGASVPTSLTGIAIPPALLWSCDGEINRDGAAWCGAEAAGWRRPAPPAVLWATDCGDSPTPADLCPLSCNRCTTSCTSCRTSCDSCRTSGDDSQTSGNGCWTSSDGSQTSCHGSRTSMKDRRMSCNNCWMSGCACRTSSSCSTTSCNECTTSWNDCRRGGRDGGATWKWPESRAGKGSRWAWPRKGACQSFLCLRQRST